MTLGLVDELSEDTGALEEGRWLAEEEPELIALEEAECEATGVLEEPVTD